MTNYFNKKSTFLIVGSLFSFFAVVAQVFAFELVIEDQSGNIRHVSEVSGKADVRFSVTSQNGQPVNGANITIALKESYTATDIPQEEKYRQAVAEEGVAVFKDVNPGRWVITAGSLMLAGIDVLDPASMRAQAAGATVAGTGITAKTITTGVIIAGVTAGGVVAISEATEGDPGRNDPSPFQ